jgi:hypothetical protein
MSSSRNLTVKLPSSSAAETEKPNQGQSVNQIYDRKEVALSQELSYTVKPEIDLQTWSALGNAVKPSRADRRQKKSWMRTT